MSWLSGPVVRLPAKSSATIFGSTRVEVHAIWNLEGSRKVSNAVGCHPWPPSRYPKPQNGSNWFQFGSQRCVSTLEPESEFTLHRKKGNKQKKGVQSFCGAGGHSP